MQWMPVVALTDQVELALPVEFTFADAGAGSHTQLAWWGGELRWRLAPSDPLENCWPITPLVRLAVTRSPPQHATRLEGDLVVSKDVAAKLHLVLDVAVQADITSSATAAKTNPGLGASWSFSDDLRAGVELVGEKHLKGEGEAAWLSGGPNLSYTHGRFWVTAGLAVGFNDTAPRNRPPTEMGDRVLAGSGDPGGRGGAGAGQRPARRPLHRTGRRGRGLGRAARGRTRQGRRLGRHLLPGRFQRGRARRGAGDAAA